MWDRVRKSLAPSRVFGNGAVSLWWMIAWVSALYWPVTLGLAARKQFWNDELFTYYISALDTFPRIWSALLTAADQNPPLFYWLSHKAAAAAGPNLIGLRLPAMAGFWIAAVCMLAFVSRRLPAVYGLLGALILMESRAYWFSYEARPYGLVLGFAAAALLCWQHAEEPRAPWWAAGLALALGLASSMHYYSILLFLPIAAAEVCRGWIQRRLNWPVWLALAAAGTSLLLYLPLIRSARSYSGTFWAKAGLGALSEYPLFIGTPALLTLTGIALLWAVFASTAPRTSPETLNRSVFPPAELVGALGMLCVVPLAVALGKFVTGAYTHRYALSAAIGLSFLIVWLLAAAFQARPGPALILAGIFSGAFLIQGAAEIAKPGADARYDHSRVILTLENDLPPDLSIAVADPLLFFELSHQAPPAMKSRLFYVAEPKIALRRVGTDSLDRGFIGMQPFAALRVSTLASVMSARRKFLIVGYPAVSWSWLVDELTSRHVPLSVVASLGHTVVLLAEPGSTVAKKLGASNAQSSR